VHEAQIRHLGAPDHQHPIAVEMPTEAIEVVGSSWTAWAGTWAATVMANRLAEHTTHRIRVAIAGLSPARTTATSPGRASSLAKAARRSSVLQLAGWREARAAGGD
jgi:hypothetical protein